MTTFIQLFMLDRTLFDSDIAAGVIAHNAQDASAFFSNKIKYGYDHLPLLIVDGVKVDLHKDLAALTSNNRELTFSNRSRISVGTSLRSGTYQYMHISEYGKLWAQYPEKGEEVRTGALNTVAPRGYVFIESTAEGRAGHFYKMCSKQMPLLGKDVQFSTMEYRPFFFPWHDAPEYVTNARVRISDKWHEYFEKLRLEHGVELSDQQKAWYILKDDEQGENMKREYPSHWTEAFERLLKGAIFGQQIQTARGDGRICDVPHTRGEPVDVYWIWAETTSTPCGSRSASARGTTSSTTTKTDWSI